MLTLVVHGMRTGIRVAPAIYLRMGIRILGRGILSGRDCMCDFVTKVDSGVLKWKLMVVCSYAEAPEIHAYFKGCAEKWDCMKYIKLSHQVIGAQWSAETSIWKIKVMNLNTGDVVEDECEVILSATGVLKLVNFNSQDWTIDD